MLGIIRVLATTDPDTLNRHGKILEEQYGYECVSACIPGQSDGTSESALGSWGSGTSDPVLAGGLMIRYVLR